nr:sperm activating peptide III [Clypeaster japonicus]
GTDSAQNLIG